MKSIRFAFVVILLSVAIVFESKSAEGIRAVDSAWAEAMKSNSVDAVMRCYAPDAIAWLPGQPEARGTQAIRAGYEKLLASVTIRDAVLSDVHYRNANDFSISWGRYSLAAIDKASASSNTLAGRFTAVAERRNGRWVYVVDHASAEPIPPTAVPAQSKP